MAWYNLTNVSAANNLFEMTWRLNELTDNTLVHGVVWSVLIITFIVFKSQGWSAVICFTTGLFISTILGILFYSLGMFGGIYLATMFILLAASMVFLWFDKESSVNL